MIGKYDFKLDEDRVYLIETLKIEGYWSTKNYTLTLQNKNIPLLNHIEELLKKKGLVIPSKRILLKIKLEEEMQKEDIIIINKNKILNFHIEKSPFDNKKLKAVTSLPYKKEIKLQIIYKNNKIPIVIKDLDSEIICKSELKCFVYKDLRFPKIELLKFLDSYCGDKKHFHVEQFLLNANEKLVASAFSALVDCEGTISHYGFKRNIQIRMRNKLYLEQWHKLLKKFEVTGRLEKDKEGRGILIEGWQDFNKLIKMGFKLYHSGKKEKFEKIMNSYKTTQISRNSYKEFYIKKLLELDRSVTNQELAKILGKSKNNINYYLLKLEKDGLVTCNREAWPYLYFISTSSVR